MSELRVVPAQWKRGKKTNSDNSDSISRFPSGPSNILQDLPDHLDFGWGVSELSELTLQY
jgi:hypothetical protein